MHKYMLKCVDHWHKDGHIVMPCGQMMACLSDSAQLLLNSEDHQNSVNPTMMMKSLQNCKNTTNRK